MDAEAKWCRSLQFGDRYDGASSIFNRLALRATSKKAIEGAMQGVGTVSIRDDGISLPHLDPAVFYHNGKGRKRRAADALLPLTVYAGGWHLAESWGCWAANTEAELEFVTPLVPNEQIFIAFKAHAPPGSKHASVSVWVGDVRSDRFQLDVFPSWHVAEGRVGADGALRLRFQSEGHFARRDARALFIGLHMFAYGAASDTRFQRDLKRRARRPIAHLLYDVATRFRHDKPTDRSFASSGASPFAAVADAQDLLAPELFPGANPHVRSYTEETIQVFQCGLYERHGADTLRTLRGIAAVRGVCVSAVAVIEVQIIIDQTTVHRAALRRGQALGQDAQGRRLQKYVFNIWHDFSDLADGRHELELRVIKIDNESCSHRESIVSAKPQSETLKTPSDAVVAVPDASAGSLEFRINAMPSMVRPASRTFFQSLPRNVLIMRVDQLGDMVCSIPAMRRIRELLPNAKLVAVLSPGNEGLARSLGLFDEIILTEFGENAEQKRRVMSADAQVRLREQLSAYHFDLAIDLSDNGDSRPLLTLSDAPFLHGFRPSVFPWLTSSIELATRDIGNQNECVPHANKLMGLVEWLGILLKTHSEVITRSELNRDMLRPIGLGTGDAYVVLHTGARLTFSRWPHYAKLAHLILERTALKIVMVVDDPEEGQQLGSALLASDRFLLIDKRLPFDQFDALLSFCAVFVGNDSGPKHLAALRGSQVISIHMARNNWSEWGQENTGVIISRKVPCCGCSIHYEADECGKDFACIDRISEHEVFDALTNLVGLDKTRPSEELSQLAGGPAPLR